MNNFENNYHKWNKIQILSIVPKFDLMIGLGLGRQAYEKGKTRANELVGKKRSGHGGATNSKRVEGFGCG